MDLTADIGLERIQRAVATIIAVNINDAIDAQNAIWEARDAAWFAVVGRDNPEFTVEQIAPDHVYSGVIPSLITSPPSFFPNCSVIAYIATPVGASHDWMEQYQITLGVEFMVKSLTLEEEVNARIQRTLEAAHSLLISDQTRMLPEIDGESLVPQLSSMPTAHISDVFVRHTTSDPNDRSFYQHGVLTYRVEKFSTY